MRRRSQLFAKGISLRLPSTSSQVQTSSSKNQHITSMNHQWSSTPPDGGAVQEFFSSLSQLFPNVHFNQNYNNSILSFSANWCEHLVVWICCIHFDRFDEAVSSNNAIDISISLCITVSTDPIEMETVHIVPDVDRAYADVVLTNVICGNIVTVCSADGNIYVRRLCRCAALYNDFFVYYQLSTIYTLSQTAQPLQIREGSEYLCRPSL